MLVLGVLWWSWTGYTWLTSVVDPEEGAVRIVIFAAMAAFLIVAICVPEAFDELALEFALAYGAVRAAHIALFVLASRDDPALRQSVVGLAVSTAIGVGLLGLRLVPRWARAGALWALALLLDMGGPYLFGSEGWKLVPGHFAERHGLIIIIALGESIVAIGVGADGQPHRWASPRPRWLGVSLSAALWWIYFDVVALVSARRLVRASRGARAKRAGPRLLLLPALPDGRRDRARGAGPEEDAGHVDDPLATVPAFALLGGVALYLLGLVGFRYRHVHTINRQRLLLALVLFALLPAAIELPALATLAIVTVLLGAMIVYETISYGEGRARVRHDQELAAEPPCPVAVAT